MATPIRVRHKPRSRVLHAVTSTAINATAHTSFELRRRRSRLLEVLHQAEWEWEQYPTPLGAASLHSMRVAVSALEAQLIELAQPAL